MATSKKIALRWIEVFLILATILSSMGFYLFWKQQSKTNPKYEAPSENSFKNNQFYLIQDLKIGRIEARINEHKEILKIKEMEQIALEAKLSTLNGNYSCLPDSLKIANPDTTQIKYCSIVEQSWLRKTEINYLDAQLINLQQQLLSLNLEKIDSQKVATKQFAIAKEKINHNRSVDIIWHTVISIILLFLLLFLFMNWKKGIQMFNWRKEIVLGISTSILFILFAYEAFGLYGPLGLCLIGLIAIIVLILQSK